MEILKSPKELKKFLELSKGNIGFVPTMGALHAGHVSLFHKAKKDSDVCIASIYVNPTQFDDPQDLSNYPSAIENDKKIMRANGINGVFLPKYDHLYPDDYSYQLAERAFSKELCGKTRPGHFTGVLTILMKLFLMIRPDKVFLGEKDYQQLELVKGMVNAFHMDIEVVGCPTVRECDGLAMSSRNKNLTQSQRQKAPKFFELLSKRGNDSEISDELAKHGFGVDYVVSRKDRRFGAVTLGSNEKKVRLIDNVLLR